MKTHNHYTREVIRMGDDVYFTVWRNGEPIKKGIVSFSDLSWWKILFRNSDFQREKVMDKIYRMAHITVDKIIHNALRFEVYEDNSKKSSREIGS